MVLNIKNHIYHFVYCLSNFLLKRRYNIQIILLIIIIVFEWWYFERTLLCLRFWCPFYIELIFMFACICTMYMHLYNDKLGFLHVWFYKKNHKALWKHFWSLKCLINKFDRVQKNFVFFKLSWLLKYSLWSTLSSVSIKVIQATKSSMLKWNL